MAYIRYPIAWRGVARKFSTGTACFIDYTIDNFKICMDFPFRIEYESRRMFLVLRPYLERRQAMGYYTQSLHFCSIVHT